jgi:HD-GYP domain-containing protein (c-di-GMP phosphodiesterase class II)
MLLTSNPSKFIQGIYLREKENPRYANYSDTQKKQEIIKYLSELIRDNLQVVRSFNDPELEVYVTPADEILRTEERTNDLINAIKKTLT